MRVAVTGSSGLIGRALLPHLRSQGHEVTRLVRRTPSASDEIAWDPQSGKIGPGLEGIDAAVHLAGAGVGDHRWTKTYKKQILDSRVVGTLTLSRALAELDDKPSVLVSGSAIGFYGDSGESPVTEVSPRGSGFLAEVVAEWEAATEPAEAAGIRVVHARTGLVVSSKGGALARLLPLFRRGLGGRVGSGNQYWSFISLRDEIRAIEFCLSDENVRGPVNLVAPQAVTNREVTEAISALVDRPARFPVPGFALRAALGEFAGDILASQNVVPARLGEAGFAWLDSSISQALETTRAE